MHAPMTWIREYVDLGDVPSRVVAERMTAAGLQVEKVVEVEELTGFKKPIRWVTLTDGDGERQVICGATNFVAGDVVAYARPPALLPGGFRIERRPAYGDRKSTRLNSSH